MRVIRELQPSITTRNKNNNNIDTFVAPQRTQNTQLLSLAQALEKFNPVFKNKMDEIADKNYEDEVAKGFMLATAYSDQNLTTDDFRKMVVNGEAEKVRHFTKAVEHGINQAQMQNAILDAKEFMQQAWENAGKPQEGGNPPVLDVNTNPLEFQKWFNATFDTYWQARTGGQYDPKLFKEQYTNHITALRETLFSQQAQKYANEQITKLTRASTDLVQNAMSEINSEYEIGSDDYMLSNQAVFSNAYTGLVPELGAKGAATHMAKVILSEMEASPDKADFLKDIALSLDYIDNTPDLKSSIIRKAEELENRSTSDRARAYEMEEKEKKHQAQQIIAQMVHRYCDDDFTRIQELLDYADVKQDSYLLAEAYRLTTMQHQEIKTPERKELEHLMMNDGDRLYNTDVLEYVHKHPNLMSTWYAMTQLYATVPMTERHRAVYNAGRSGTLTPAEISMLNPIEFNLYKKGREEAPTINAPLTKEINSMLTLEFVKAGLPVNSATIDKVTATVLEDLYNRNILNTETDTNIVLTQARDIVDGLVKTKGIEEVADDLIVRSRMPRGLLASPEQYSTMCQSYINALKRRDDYKTDIQPVIAKMMKHIVATQNKMKAQGINIPVYFYSFSGGVPEHAIGRALANLPNLPTARFGGDANGIPVRNAYDLYGILCASIYETIEQQKIRAEQEATKKNQKSKTRKEGAEDKIKAREEEITEERRKRWWPSEEKTPEPEISEMGGAR